MRLVPPALRVCDFVRVHIRVINISLILVSMTLMDDAAITSGSAENGRHSFIIKREELSTVEGRLAVPNIPGSVSLIRRSSGCVSATRR